MFEIDRRSPFLGLDVGRALEDRFRTLWGPLLDPFWARLGPCWGDLGASWGHLGPSRGHLGPLLAILRPSWGYVPAMLGYWGYLGPICDCLGAILSFIGAHVELSVSVFVIAACTHAEAAIEFVIAAYRIRPN